MNGHHPLPLDLIVERPGNIEDTRILTVYHDFSISLSRREAQFDTEPATMMSALLWALGSLSTTYLFLSALLHLTQDPKEPLMLGTSIPFITPVLGMISGMQKFTVKLRSATPDIPLQGFPHRPRSLQVRFLRSREPGTSITPPYTRSACQASGYMSSTPWRSSQKSSARSRPSPSRRSRPRRPRL